jgi:hypothetical protein
MTGRFASKPTELVTTRPQNHHHGRRAQRPSNAEGSFVSVYVDTAASPGAVQAAVAQLPMPAGVTKVVIDDHSVTDTLGCRIAVDLTGDFTTATGKTIARGYAERLTAVLGVRAFALCDVLRADPTKFNC